MISIYGNQIFFGNPYIDPYIVYRLSGSEFSLLKNFFYTQTQIIGKFIYEFPKKNLISIYGNHGVIDMKNNKLLVVFHVDQNNK